MQQHDGRSAAADPREHRSRHAIRRLAGEAWKQVVGHARHPTPSAPPATRHRLQDLVGKFRLVDGARQHHGADHASERRDRLLALLCRRFAGCEPRQGVERRAQRLRHRIADRLGLARDFRAERRHQASRARRIPMAGRQIAARDFGQRVWHACRRPCRSTARAWRRWRARRPRPSARPSRRTGRRSRHASARRSSSDRQRRCRRSRARGTVLQPRRRSARGWPPPVAC